MGIRKLVADPMKITDPTQSTLLSFSLSLLGLKFSFRKRGTKTRATPMKGRLM